MAIEITKNVKCQAKNIQLEKHEVSASVTEIHDSAADGDVPSKKSTAPNSPLHQPTPVSDAKAKDQRQYRSMLVVDQPPTIEPLNPLSYDEFYPRAQSVPLTKNGANPTLHHMPCLPFLTCLVYNSLLMS